MHTGKLTLIPKLLAVVALVVALCLSGFAQAATITELKTFTGDEVVIEKDKLTHLIFMDAWSIYGGSGDDTLVGKLPAPFLQTSQQVWIQPAMNVTLAQLAEFQGYFPSVSPLVLDHGFKLMRDFGIWNSPHHILLQGNKAVFSGTNDDLKQYTQKNFSTAQALTQWRNSKLAAVDLAPKAQAVQKVSFAKASSYYKKPAVGSKAPAVSATTLAGRKVSASALLQDKPVTLVFVDALCPMPQLPGCEAKLSALNKQIAADDSRHWLGVISSYYVSEDVARVFTEKFKLSLPLIFDTDNTIFKAFDVHATPYVIDLSKEGLIASRGDVTL